MFLSEFPSMGESGSRNEIITDTQISVSFVITTYPPIVCKSSSTNIHVTTQILGKSGTNENMAVFDHNHGQCHRKVRPYTESIYL